jgi:ATP-binding cassette subfamily G (WHITE) protein 2 (SNQ2)
LNEYFSNNGVDIPKDVNPAERMIDIVSGDMSKDQDWAQVWSDSDLCKQQMEELEKIKSSGSEGQDKREDDGDEYASSTVTQLKLVTKRASIQLWRDTEYVVNKVSNLVNYES